MNQLKTIKFIDYSEMITPGAIAESYEEMQHMDMDEFTGPPNFHTLIDRLFLEYFPETLVNFMKVARPNDYQYHLDNSEGDEDDMYMTILDFLSYNNSYSNNFKPEHTIIASGTNNYTEEQLFAKEVTQIVLDNRLSFVNDERYWHYFGAQLNERTDQPIVNNPQKIVW